MTAKTLAAAACLALPLVIGAGARAQVPTHDVDCELGLRWVSDRVNKLTNKAIRDDVHELYKQAQIAQKSNDAKTCQEKLTLAFHRANWTPGASGGAGDNRPLHRTSMTSPNDSALFSAIDANKNGQLSRDEYMAYRSSRYVDRAGRTRLQYDNESRDMFARRDRNADGIITADEFSRGG